MNEQYVSFEIAKLLKEKGFDWPTIEYYSLSGGIYRFSEGIAGICGILSYPRPTQQMACDWVEKTYGFFIEVSRHIDINGNYHYFYMILDKECKYASSGTHDNNYPSKYEAVEAALQYCLTNLI